MTKYRLAVKTLLVFVTAFLLLFVTRATRIQAYDLYELVNLIDNGDIALDSNSDGLADNFVGGGSGTRVYSIVNGSQKALNQTGGSLIVYQNVTITNGHIYYARYTATETFSITGFRFGYKNAGTSDFLTIATNDLDGRFLFTAPSGWAGFYFGTVSTVLANESFTVDNVIIIDLTAQFGAGLEPSLSDFETLYMPQDLEYFDTYQSFDSGPYTQISLSDYPDLASDLTGIDYKKSIIDTYGENISIDIYAYFYDTPSLAGDVAAQYYVTLNNPEIDWRNANYVLDWSFSDYSERVLVLDMDADQEDTLKRALFDRNIGTDWDTDYTEDDGYMKIDIEGTAVDNVKFYVVFSSIFDLRVDVASFLVSWDTDVHDNLFSINQEMYIKCQDKYDQTLLPALSAIMGDYRTTVINDFGSSYTDVMSFNIEFEFVSPEPTDDSIVQTIYLYELGVFSSSDVVFGFDDPDFTLDPPFDYGVCDWYELGCQAKNTINDIALSLYETLRINEIVATVTGIIDDVGQIAALLPDEVGAIMIIIFSAVGVAIIIVIVLRATGGGDSG